MTDQGIQIEDWPELKNPYLIAGFGGWGNALNISKGMTGFLRRELKARRFAMRKNDLETKAHKLKIDLVTNMENQNDIGYCISTISAGNRGEIDSLFIKEPYRRQGIGKRLMVSALAWLAEQAVMETSAYVAYGNDEATGFYRRFDFYPRNMQLIRKP